MKVLVTGGAGYVGSHAAKIVAGEGHIPIVVDNLSTGHAESVKWGPLIELDILDQEAIRSAFEEHRPDAVFHFAARADSTESFTFPELYQKINVEGTRVLINTMRDFNTKILVFSSSCAVYGSAPSPIGENAPLSPVSPYGKSKINAELAIKSAGVDFGLRWASLRYFNAAGADPNGDIGEMHDPETHVIPRALLSASQHKTFQVYGTDFDTSDGTAIRDYVHVNDLGYAHFKAMSYLMNGGKSGAFNLGSGQGTSVREILSVIKEITGHEILTEELGRRINDVSELISNHNKAKNILSWMPTLSDMRTIIQTAWNWHRSRLMDKKND